MVSSREEIIKILEGGRCDRVPRALYGAGRWAYRQARLAMEDLVKDPRSFGDRLADVFRTLDSDIVFAGSGLNTLPAEAIGGSLSFKEGQAPLLSFPIIHDAGDATYLREIDISGSPYTIALTEMIAVMRRRLPERFVCATSWGPFTWAMILCDWTRLKEKTANDREFIGEVCGLGVRLSKAFCGPLISAGLIDGIAVPDGAATLIPNDLYKEVVLPRERELFDWARGFGIKSFLHQCGSIQQQYSLYPETGADCISVDAGVPIGEVYECYHRTTVTAGNVDAVNMILSGNPEMICREVTSCIGAVADPHRKFILMPSCDIPPDTPLGNVQAFLSCA